MLRISSLSNTSDPSSHLLSAFRRTTFAPSYQLTSSPSLSPTRMPTASPSATSNHSDDSNQTVLIVEVPFISIILAAIAILSFCACCAFRRRMSKNNRQAVHGSFSNPLLGDSSENDVEHSSADNDYLRKQSTFDVALMDCESTASIGNQQEGQQETQLVSRRQGLLENEQGDDSDGMYEEAEFVETTTQSE